MCLLTLIWIKKLKKNLKIKKEKKLTNKLISSIDLSLLKEKTSFLRLLKLIMSVFVLRVKMWQLCKLSSVKSSKFPTSSEDCTRSSISFFNMVSVVLTPPELAFCSLPFVWLDEALDSFDLSSSVLLTLLSFILKLKLLKNSLSKMFSITF